MEVKKECGICGQNMAAFMCKLCGNLVCAKCIDSKGLCKRCGMIK